MASFTRERDEGFPEHLVDRWWTPNIQVCTGVIWNLVVVDLDGPGGIELWDFMASLNDCPPTWEVRHDPCGGKHLWFASPVGVSSVPFDTKIWKGGKHEGIQLLGDRNLAVAPPSIHCETGRRYEFTKGNSPREIQAIPPLPSWVIDWATASRTPEIIAHRPVRPRLRIGPSSARYDRQEVAAAIPDKLGLIRSWGINVRPYPNDAGWAACYRIDRQERNPSASINAESGIYWEPGRKTMSLFDLAVERGVYATWQEACDDLGATYTTSKVQHA